MTARACCWTVQVPGERAAWLASPSGPLRDGRGFLRPGVVQNLGGGLVRLDATAVASLAGHGGDGRVVPARGGKVMAIGQDAYPLVPGC